MEKLKGAKKVAIVGNGGIATELIFTLKGVQVKLNQLFLLHNISVTFRK